MKINEVKINEGRRVTDQKKIKELADSIKELGLLNPITVNEDGTLIAGMHRLEACKLLGYDEIKVNKINLSSLLAELAEIDENLVRNELHWLEQDKQLKRRKAIYEELHPETKHNSKFKGNQFRSSEIISSDQKTFTEDTADKLGQSQRNIQMSVARAESIEDEEVIEQIKELDISKTEGTILSRFEPDQQKKIIEVKKQKTDFSIKEIVQEIKKEEKQLELEKKKEEYKKTSLNEVISKPEIHLTDAVNYLSTFEDNSIDLLITDPPYATDVKDINIFTKNWLEFALKKVKKSGRLYICSGAYPNELQAFLNVLMNQDKFIVDNPLIWTYRNTLGVTPKMKYNLNYQVIWHLYSEDSAELDTSITNEMFSVQDINAPDGRIGNRLHTWQKPDELANRLIRHGSVEGDLVVDCFACTGTFLISASKFNRIAKGCDISKDNLNIAKERGCTIIGM